MTDTTLTAAGDVVERHYRNLAARYDTFLRYSPDFVRTMTQKMIENLRLGPDDRFVDLGGGTGLYALDIMRQVPFRQPVLLVDPIADMLARAPDDPRLERLCLDAESFARKPGTYDKILMKEAVHHVAVADRGPFFQDIFARLGDGGRILLVHIPPEIEYPLFSAAIERSRTWHADPDELCDFARAAGFEVERERLEISHALPKEVYFEMVRGRYMSLLSSFEAEEIEAGLAEMSATHAAREVLEFNDRFDFITASKAPRA